MSVTPQVSVVMAVHNGAAFLAEAIESVLRQTFTGFEFIIIDDGSTDDTAALLQRYRKGDPRISVYHHDRVGLTLSLNRGLAAARGEYIARMDADDVSLPERFAKQVSFMEANPDVGICGTWIRRLGTVRERVLANPTDHETIRCWLLFDSPLVHPSVMLRQTAVTRGLTYDPSYAYCQDYDLWERAASEVMLANVPEVLLLYRTHPQQMLRSYSSEVRFAEGRRVWLRQLERLGLRPTPEEAAVHEAISRLEFAPTRELIARAEAWLRTLEAANARTFMYDRYVFNRVLGQWWFFVCHAASELGTWTWRTFWRSTLAKEAGLRPVQVFLFRLQCAVGWSRLHESVRTSWPALLVPAARRRARLLRKSLFSGCS